MSGLANYWRDIPGTDGKYQISRLGEVQHVWPSGLLTPLRPFFKPRKRKDGTWVGSRVNIKLRIDGKDHTRMLFSCLTAAWLGPPPPGMVYYHKNGILSDNRLDNVGIIDKRELGKKNGPRSKRKSVEKVDPDGNVVALYTSAREAAEQNYMYVQGVLDRRENRIKKPYALNGYTFRREDTSSGKSRQNTRRKA